MTHFGVQNETILSKLEACLFAEGPVSILHLQICLFSKNMFICCTCTLTLGGLTFFLGLGCPPTSSSSSSKSSGSKSIFNLCGAHAIRPSDSEVPKVPVFKKKVPRYLWRKKTLAGSI
eukprot:Pompholyxophrys_sp_v1_NODE_139_length_1613_cov_10.258023.p2 type:complete len:118 gc:universal NODE_139_length_1613_cov_10.258023:1061-1414(+)